MRWLPWLAGSVLAVVAPLALGGCMSGASYDWHGAVSHQASFDHHCPEQQIQVVRDNGDPIARAVEVNVCGRPRMYRDIGGTRMYLWQDVTELNGGVRAAPAAPAPPAEQTPGSHPATL